MPGQAYGPAYQLTLYGTIFDQPFVNVWNYVVYEGEGGEADALGVAFKIAILANLVAIQSVAVEYQYMQVNGERDSTDVATIDCSDYAGLVAGDCLPPYAAWSFMISRSSNQMRHGFKRFPGVAESWQTNGEVAAGAPDEAMETLAEQLKVDLELEGGLIAPLVVPKRQWHNAPVIPAEFWVPADVVFKGISTQNSRKFGH